jgi:hypothetical protein
VRRALPLAALLLLLESVVGAWWALVALLTWGAVRTGLRAGLSLRREVWERRVRARLRREIAAADEERAIGVVEMVRPGPLPYRAERDRDLFREPDQPEP